MAVDDTSMAAITVMAAVITAGTIAIAAIAVGGFRLASDFPIWGPRYYRPVPVYRYPVVPPHRHAPWTEPVAPPAPVTTYAPAQATTTYAPATTYAPTQPTYESIGAYESINQPTTVPSYSAPTYTAPTTYADPVIEVVPATTTYTQPVTTYAQPSSNYVTYDSAPTTSVPETVYTIPVY